MGRIATLIDETVAATDDVGGRHEWNPAHGCEALSDQQDERAGSRVAMAFHLGSTFMAAPAREGMTTLRSMLTKTPPLGFVPYPVARTTIETLARAWWLFELGIGARQRVARGLTEFIYAARQQIDLPDVDRQYVEGLLNRVTAMAGECGLEVRHADDGLPSKVGDVHRPKTGALLRQFYDPPELGAWVHADTSGMSHGDVVALFSQIATGEEEHGQYQYINPDEGRVRMLVACVLYAWWETDRRRVDYVGWRDPEWQQAAQRIMREISAMIAPLTRPS